MKNECSMKDNTDGEQQKYSEEGMDNGPHDRNFENESCKKSTST